MERRRCEERKKGGSKGGEGGHGCEVQKPTVMVPMQRGGGEEGRRRGEKSKGRRDRRGVGTQNWPLMESKHYHVFCCMIHHRQLQTELL